MKQRAPLTLEQSALVQSHMHVVDIVTKQLCREFPTVMADDVRSLADEGLCWAAQSFKKELEVPFEPYAVVRVRFFARTGLAKDRKAWRAWKLVAAEAGAAFAEMTDHDPALTMAEDEAAAEAYADRRRGFVLSMVAGLAGASPETNPGEEEIVDAETRLRLQEQLGALVGGLAARDRELVERHYFEGRQLKDIGEDTGVSYATIRRRHHAAVLKLAARMRS